MQHLDGELRVREVVDEKWQCQDWVAKPQIEDEILQEQLEKLW